MTLFPNQLRIVAILLPFAIGACGAGEGSPTVPESNVAVPEPAGVTDVWRYGVDSGLELAKVEDHSDALLYWLQRGCKNRRVLHIDTHDDARLISDANVTRVQELYAAGKWDELKAASGVAYSSGAKAFNIGNFLYTAWKLGVVREVCWVIPGEPAQIADIARVRGWLQVIGFDAASANSFRLVDGVIRGQRSGMPMIICTAKNIPKSEEPTLLSLDIDYLAGPYRDPESTPMRDLVLALHEGIRASDLRTDFALISYSVHGGSIPLEHKYAGDYFEKLIMGPEAEQHQPAFWSTRVAALTARHRGEHTEAVTGLVGALELRPNDPSLWLDLARVQLEQGDGGAACDSIGQAVKQDPSYYLGYVELAWVVLNDVAFESSDRVGLQRQLIEAAENSLPVAGQGQAEARLGGNYLDGRKFRRAQIEYFKVVEGTVPPERLHGFKSP